MEYAKITFIFFLMFVYIVKKKKLFVNSSHCAPVIAMF